MGRKQTPTKLKVLRSNPGRRPLPKDEPQPQPISGSKPPAHLLKSEKAYWRRYGPALERVGLLTDGDVAKFSLVCRLHVEEAVLSKAVRAKGGREYVTDGGMIRPRPIVTQLRDVRKQLDSLWSEFGGSPSSRTGLSVKPPGDDGERSIIERRLGG